MLYAQRSTVHYGWSHDGLSYFLRTLFALCLAWLALFTLCLLSLLVRLAWLDHIDRSLSPLIGRNSLYTRLSAHPFIMDAFPYLPSTPRL